MKTPREFWIRYNPLCPGLNLKAFINTPQFWFPYKRIKVIESTPLTRNAGDMLKALKLIVHDYWQRLPEGEVRKLEKLITKAEGGDEPKP